MWRCTTFGWLAFLVAGSAHGYHVLDTSSRRYTLEREGVSDDYNDGDHAGIFRQRLADHAGDRIALYSVSGIDDFTLPDRLVAEPRVEFSVPYMFVAFTDAEKTVHTTVGINFDDATPSLDDLEAAADLIEAYRLCSDAGRCSEFDVSPLRSDDVVLLELP